MSNVRRSGMNSLIRRRESRITSKEGLRTAATRKAILVVYVLVLSVLGLTISAAGRAAADVTFCGSVSGNWTDIATQTQSFQTVPLILNDTSPATWGTAPEEDYTFNVTVNDPSGQLESAMVTDSAGLLLATVSSGTGQGVTTLTFAAFKIKLPNIPITIGYHLPDCTTLNLGPINPQGAGKLVCVGTPIDNMGQGTTLYLAPSFPNGTPVPQVGQNSGIYDLGSSCGNQPISASASSWKGKQYMGWPYPKDSREQKAATACGIAAADQPTMITATANSTPCKPHNEFTFTQPQGTINRQATYGYDKAGNITGQQVVALTIQQRGDVTVTPVAAAGVCSGMISGKCLWNDGTAVSGATVTLTGVGNQTSGTDGSYMFGMYMGPQLQPGTNYQITATTTTMAGPPPHQVTINGTPQPANPQTVASCQTTTVNFTFQR